MDGFTLSEEDILKTTLSSVTESGYNTFPCETLSLSEKQALNQTQSEVDIDYFMVKEECSVLLSKRQILDFFSDCSSEIYSNTKKCGLYSTTVKEVLVLGKIGDYQIGTLYSEKLRSESFAEDEIDENTYEDKEFENTGDDSGLTRDDVVSRLKRISEIVTGRISFNRMADLLRREFDGIVLVIWKYGQKIPLKDVLPRIIRILSDAGLPIEVALGVQFSSPSKFYTAKTTQDHKNYGFSNFLSNNMCNIRINNSTLTEIYATNCYRLCIYNTLQHSKKDIDLLLERTPGHINSTLSAFEGSIFRNFSALSRLSDKIMHTSLRLELYFTVGNIVNFNNAISSMKTLLPEFELVSKNSLDVDKIFLRRMDVMKAFFSYSKMMEDIRCLFFILYYARYITFIDSTQKTTDAFLNTNCGMFLPEYWIDRSTKLLTRYFFDANTIPQVWYMLLSVFGESKLSRPNVCFYFMLYFNHFISYLDTNVDFARKCADYIGKSLVMMEKITKRQLLLNSSTFGLNDLLFALGRKHKELPFYRGFLDNLKTISSVNGNFIKELTTILIQNRFQSVINCSLFTLMIQQDGTSAHLCWKEIQEFGREVNYEDLFISESEMESLAYSEERSDNEFLVKIRGSRRMMDRIFQTFCSCLKAQNDNFFGEDMIPYDSKIKPDIAVFASFFLMSFPVNYTERNSVLKKAVDIFKDFAAFVQYLYVALFKYYNEKKETPKKMKSFISNFISAKRYMGKNFGFDMTFNRFTYCSGRFDRLRDVPGLFLPIDARCDIKSRIGKVPYRHLTDFGQMMSLPEANPRSFKDPLDAVFAKFDNVRNPALFSQGMLNDVISPVLNNTALLHDNESDKSDASILDYSELLERKDILKPTGMSTNNSPLIEHLNTNSIDAVLNKNEALFNDVPASDQPSTILPANRVQFLGKISLPPKKIDFSPLDGIIKKKKLANLASAFRMKLQKIFPSEEDKTFINILISKNITEEVIIESSEEELKETLQRHCKLSTIDSICTAVTLKQKYPSKK